APRSVAATPATDIGFADGNIAEARGARLAPSAPSRWSRAAIRIGWADLVAYRSAQIASSCRRCSRQNRSTSAPAPRRAACGASKATRRHGTWLLTRTQQITVLSKHLLSKQPLNPAKNSLAGQPIRILQ